MLALTFLLYVANIFRYLQINMDDEDFPRGKRRKLGTDTEVKEVRTVSLDKELFSEVKFNDNYRSRSEI